MVAKPHYRSFSKGGSRGKQWVEGNFKTGANKKFLQFGWFEFPGQAKLFFQVENAVTVDSSSEAKDTFSMFISNLVGLSSILPPLLRSYFNGTTKTGGRGFQ